MTRRIHVPFVFRDSENIYLEFSAIPDGPQGYVLRFPFTEAGFAKACKHIPDISPPPGHAAVAPRVIAAAQERKVRIAQRASGGTPEVDRKRRAQAKYAKEESKEFLTKMGLVKR